MKSNWDESAAATYTGDLALLNYIIWLLHDEPSLRLHDGGCGSVKVHEPNVLHDDDEVLYISNSLHQLDGKPGAPVPVRLMPLVSLIRLDALTDSQLTNELACNRTVSTEPVAPLDSLVHAVVPAKYVVITQPDALFAIGCALDGVERLHAACDESVITVEYARAGFPLAKSCLQALQQAAGDRVTSIFIMHQALLTFGNTARECYERVVDVVTAAEQYLTANRAWEITFPVTQQHPQPTRQAIAELRKAIADVAGFPVILATTDDRLSLEFSRRNDLPVLSQQGPAIAGHVKTIKHLPMLGRDVVAYHAAYEHYGADHFTDNASANPDAAPRIVLDPSLGMCAIGRTAGEAKLGGTLYRRTVEIILRSMALGGYRAMPAAAVVDMMLSQAAESPMQKPWSLFTGEVALVTGAASGIGKACVESLLARGAAVVGVDISPKIVGLFDSDSYRGIICDLTNEEAISQAFDTAVRAFGGLDMLVLNAGIFPAGCRIDSLQLSEWQRVMHINLDSNLSIMREAYPLLKLSPRYGRVVVNGSRNVPAPGPGAAAYSASKAAVTQLARVAALEWGKDHIRINMVHPHAVFDTGIWTEEVLKARSASYGMTIEQYKTNNILRVELTSHDVGEMVATMCGPLFAKTTGAQVPMDGGSDRVI